MKKTLTACLMLACSVSAQVSICTLYDGREFAEPGRTNGAAVSFMADDYDYNHMPQRFLDYADACGSNGIVLGVGVICKYGSPSLVSNLQSRIDAGYVEVCNHSWEIHDPDAFPTDQIQADMELSTAYLKTNYTFQSYLRYNGSNYLTAWIQPWGQPTTNLVYLDVLRPILAEMGYLSDRKTAGGQTTFSEWDEEEGLFERWTTSASSTSLIYHASVYNGAVSNKGVYSYFCHPGSDDVSASILSRTGFYYDLIVERGNRKNDWYVGPNALYTYRYIATRANVAVEYVDYNKDHRFTCSIGQADRDKYGLSVPVTYKYDLPDAWTNAIGVIASVQWGTNDWQALPEKTTNDFFNNVNCYRWSQASNCVYVSYGFPETGTNFTVRITPKSRPMPGFLFSIVGGN